MTFFTLLAFAAPAVACAAVAPAPPLHALPLPIVANRGQEDPRALFVARAPGASVWFARDGFRLALAAPGAATGVNLFLTFDGAAPRSVAALELGAGRVHTFRGATPAGWTAGAPVVERLRYEALYPGVDVDVFERAGRIEYDLCVEDGAALERVQVNVDGADSIALEQDGRVLVLGTACGPVRQELPQTFAQDDRGVRSPARARFALLGERRFGFAWDGPAPRGRAVVDPGLSFSTFLGSSDAAAADTPRAIAAPTPEFCYVTGKVSASGFPTVPGSFDVAYNLNGDAFVAKIKVTAPPQLVFASYLGGTQEDSGNAIAVAASGAVAVAGFTRSPNFPVTAGAPDPFANGIEDAFLTVVAPAGDTLLLSTFLGGNGADFAHGVAFDGAVAAVCGSTQSMNFPTTAGAFDTSANGGVDAFVARYDVAAPALLASTFLGGGANDEALAAALAAGGDVVVAGQTFSSGFPTAGVPFDATFNGIEDLFVSRLTPALGLAASTFLGGAFADFEPALALGPAGAITLCGVTLSPNFPVTVGAFDVTLGGSSDIVVAALDANAATLTFATFLGGSGTEAPADVAVDAAGDVYAGGTTLSADFPTSFGAFDVALDGLSDACVARLSADGATLLFSTFVGGGNSDDGAALALDPGNSVHLYAQTASADAPQGEVLLDGSLNGSVDGYVAVVPTRTCSAPPQALKYGPSKPGATGAPTLAVVEPLAVPTASGSLEIANALPGASGLLFLGLSQLSIAFDGGRLLVNPFAIMQLPPFDGAGKLTLASPVQNDPALCGVALYLQVYYVDPAAAGPYHTAQTAGLKVTFGSL